MAKPACIRRQLSRLLHPAFRLKTTQILRLKARKNPDFAPLLSFFSKKVIFF